jgi:hypothetical protein
VFADLASEVYASAGGVGEDEGAALGGTVLGIDEHVGQSEDNETIRRQFVVEE